MINPTHVTTDKVRLSYASLFTPSVGLSGGDPKYNVTVLLPKSDTATKARIDAAIDAAKVAGAEKKWNGVVPPVVPHPVHDGDGRRPSDGAEFGPECKGHWVFTASSKQNQPPKVVDANLNPIIDQTEIYSGIYARVSVDFYPYFAGGKKGVGCGLGNVQKLEDGEPLAGRRSTPEEDFASVSQAAPQVQPQYQQQTQVTPQVQPQYQQQIPSGAVIVNPLTGEIIG
ncbi:MAG: DUF2815 family protein [Clostridiales bacterium]